MKKKANTNITNDIITQTHTECLAQDGFRHDPWQKQVMEHHGSITIRAGRQVGKSVIVGRKTAKLATEFPGITIMMVAAAQRQSSEIFEKTLSHLYTLHQALLKKAGGFDEQAGLSARQNYYARLKFEHEHGLFKELPTKTQVKLKNGTRILSLPTGKTGAYIRCYTVDILVADEAAFIPEPVWVAIKPMLAVAQKERGLGWEILLSTPFGKGGYYFESFHDSDFLQIHISSENCPRIPRKFLTKERNRLSKLEYAQEYLGEFIDEFHQFFPTQLIKARMTFITWKFNDDYRPHLSYYLGVDIARYGADENAFVITEMDKTCRKLKVVKVLTTQRKSLTDTTGTILELYKKFKIKRIFIDDAGVGGGVYDMLVENLSKSKVEGLNNASKRIDNKRGILKEDLYSHAAMLMEQGRIDIIANLKLLSSLRSMTFEYTSNQNLKIYGKNSHLAEAFVRSCWSLKSKALKLFVY